MPPRKSTRKSTKRSQRGKGISDVLNFIKDNKLVSKGLGMIPHPGAQAAASLAAMAGLGRKRRSGTRRKTTRKAPAVRTGTTRRKTATSRRRRTVVPAAMQGRGIFGDLGGGIGSIFGGLGSGVGSIAHGLFGGSARRGRKPGNPRLGIKI